MKAKESLKKLKPVEREEWFLQVAHRVKELLLQPEGATSAAQSDEVAQVDEARRADDSVDAPADTQATPTPVGTASWEASIPPHMAVAEIESHLSRLKRHTRLRGFAVFDRDGYYVQFAYYARLDDSSVVVEAQSNAYLQGSRRLSRLQLKHLTDDLQFSQATPDENLLMYAPLDSEKSITQLAHITWHVLTEVYPCLEDSPLRINAQCQ